jgi:F-type H+-transporting ATPase subunit gamma
MPNLIDLRRRIRSVKNMRQITSAMKMVSAAKLRRAHEKAIAARPYSTLLRDMLSSILAHLPEDSPVREHPLLARREVKHITLVLISGDKGLCGAFNSNVIRAASRFLQEHGSEKVQLEMVGRRGRDYFRRRPVSISGEWLHVFARTVEYSKAEEIAGTLMERFIQGKTDAIYLLYNEFKSALSQRLVLEPLLPVESPAAQEGASVDYIYEQPPEDIFRALLPKYVKSNVYHAMLESGAAEHAARMAAMDAASRNADEVAEKLTLHLNRVRQASITNELIEVVSGASALE